MTSVRADKPRRGHGETASARALRAVGRMLNIQLNKPVDVVRLTREGVEPAAMDALIQRGFAANELAWIVKPRTLSHRKLKDERLTPEESDRWFRAAKIQALALEVFGNSEKALAWLHKPRQAFQGLNAIQMLQSETGVRLVEDQLNQLDAGYFA